MASEIFWLAKDIGFPSVVLMLLLYDKMKNNGHMKRLIENNNEILTRIEVKLK